MMTSLTKRLTGEGTGQAMEYEEELVHNVLTAAQNAIVSIAKKVKDNVLHVMTVLVIVPCSPLHSKAQRPTLLQVPCLGCPMPLSSSRYVCLWASSRWLSHGLSLLKPKLSNDTSHISPSVLHLGRSHGVISLGARPLKA